MPRGGTKDTGSQQEVTRQVGRALGHSDSVNIVRSLSPVSAYSDHNLDSNELVMSKLRIAELEHELKLAKENNELFNCNNRRVVGNSDMEPQPGHSHQVDEVFPKHRPFIHTAIDLPRVELTSFDGNPEQYCQFIRQYENFIECKTQDPGQRFLYLLHYCRGRAKEAIQGCAMLDPELGYPRARNILRDMFGQPFQVARNMIDGVLAEARRIRGDLRSLSNLVIKMQNCSIALDHLNYRSDLDAMHTLESIVRCLPVELQAEWAKEADRIGRFNREANFEELTEFINSQSRIANSRFGHLVRESNRSWRGSTSTTSISPKLPNVKPPWANTHAISQGSPRINMCKLCSGNHRITDCDRFLNMTVPERWGVAKRTGACFTCLNDSHRAAACRSLGRCDQDGCRGTHHKLLHQVVNRGYSDTANNDSSTGKQTHDTKTVCTTRRTSSGPVRLGIVPVNVDTPCGVVRAVAFLDSGSDTTLVTEDFAKHYCLKGLQTSLVISTVHGTQTVHSSQISLKVMPISGDNAIEIPQAFTIANLPMRAAESIKDLAQRWPHLHDIQFEDIPSPQVDILIGCDVPEAHWVMDQRIGGRREPYALRTALGWTLCGPLSTEDRQSSSINYISNDGGTLEAELERFYNNEFGDSAGEDGSMSREDKIAMDIVIEGTRYQGNHLEVPLPWRPGFRKIPNNRQIALTRLHYLKGRLKRNPDLRKSYCEAMQCNLDRGYIERVMMSAPKGKTIWYLPHHPVINPRKPKKIRVVFDCAAKCEGVSLNDQLLQGPDMTTPLVEVLCRFRMGRIAVAADIQEMFMQVKVPPDQRDALRLWWWPDGDIDAPAQEYRMTVHPFGAVSSPFCANYALRTTATSHTKDFDPSIESCVSQNFYVDDFLGSFDTVEEAVKHVSNLSKLLSMGGFRLTKWTSNCRSTLDTIPEDERSPSLRELHGDTLPTERALGVQWDAEKDEFVLKLQLPDRKATRRGVLSSLSSLYDPLGFVSPWLLPGKIVLQNLCRKKAGWDDELDEKDGKAWGEWLNSLSRLGDIKLPRYIPEARRDHCAELHLFSDASEVGYGVVAYGRSRDQNQGWCCSLLYSKARVTPMKAVSIPRLELSAAVLAVKVAKMLKRCFNSTTWELTYWTDSAIVLHYVNNVKTRFCTFVANRLTIIHEETTVQQWRYVKSADNPADFCSRGLKSLEKLDIWLRGPDFLKSDEISWPRLIIPTPSEAEIEKKRLVCVTGLSNSGGILDKLQNFSSWSKMLIAVAWWIRFKQQMIILKGIRPEATLNLGPLLPAEIKQAERDVVRLVQEERFASEIGAIRANDNGRSGPRLLNSGLKPLNPILVDGLLRVGGRLNESDLSFDAKHPLILPGKHHITDLLIRHMHIEEGHAGSSQLLSTIRQRFWITAGKAAVNRILVKCMFCKRCNAVAGKQMMADLPAARVTEGWWPFAETGVDFFGPLLVKVHKRVEKRYGCLLTCLQSRAVHLEVAHTMSTDSFLMAFQRFVGRRGLPNNMYSDNGSNFVGAQRELLTWWRRLDRDEIRRKTSLKGVNWHFNPPYASHRGGVWERLIRSARRILTALTAEQPPNDETLSTLLVEVERILNNRPLVPVSSDDVDSLALTPNDLLLRRSNVVGDAPTTLRGTYLMGWRRASYMTRIFWRRWVREYLPSLQSRQKWITKGRSFKRGDVVLISDEQTPKNKWPLGLIKDCRTDSDGLVRTVVVKTGNGECIRDIRQVCLLEGDDANDEHHEPEGEPDNV